MNSLYFSLKHYICNAYIQCNLLKTLNKHNLWLTLVFVHLSIICVYLHVYNQCKINIQHFHLLAYYPITVLTFKSVQYTGTHVYTQLEFIVLNIFTSQFSHKHIIPKRDITHPKCYIHVQLHVVIDKFEMFHQYPRNAGTVVN